MCFSLNNLKYSEKKSESYQRDAPSPPNLQCIFLPSKSIPIHNLIQPSKLGKNTDPYISLKSHSSFLNYLTVCFIVKENVPYVFGCHVSLGSFNMSYFPSIFLTFMIAMVLRTIGQLFCPLMWVCGSQTSKWLQRFLSPCIHGPWSTFPHCTWGDLCDQENTTEVRACT